MAEVGTTNTVTPSSSNIKPPSFTVSSTVVLLILRVLIFVSLFLAFTLITITKEIANEHVWKFKDFHAYRYMIFTIVIGSAYNNVQLVRSIYTVVTGNRVLNNDVGYMIDFLGDKIASYVLLSGSAAGFGLSVDVEKMFIQLEIYLTSFFGKANASASLLLIGFVFTAIASICSSLALPKKA